MKHLRFLSLLLAALMAVLPLSALAESPASAEDMPEHNVTAHRIEEEEPVALEEDVVIEPIIPEDLEKTIIGADNRITIDNPNQYPYSAIAYLVLEFECGHGGEGSGFMVGRYGMMTAGHCVVCGVDGAQLSSMVAYFGYRNSKNYAYRYAGNFDFWWDGRYDYTSNDSLNWDYAFFKLDQPVGDTTGTFGVVAKSDRNLDMNLVQVAGYRDGLLKTDFDYAHIDGEYVISYQNDSVPGNSGCPVFDSNNNVVAIHVAGSDSLQLNFGRRITSSLCDAMRKYGVID